jgi:hypothetical protein
LPYNINGQPAIVTFEEKDCSFDILPIIADQYLITDSKNDTTNNIILIIKKEDAEKANCIPLAKVTFYY